MSLKIIKTDKYVLFQFMNFIILIIARVGSDGNPVSPAFYDAAIVSAIVSYGLFIVVVIQLIAILLGDKTPITVNKSSTLT